MINNRRDSPQATRPAGAPRTIRWDDSHLKSSYAVLCNGSSTGEDFILVFRVNQAPKRGQTGVQVQPTNCVILSPFAVKQMAALRSLPEEIGEATVSICDFVCLERPHPLRRRNYPVEFRKAGHAIRRGRKATGLAHTTRESRAAEGTENSFGAWLCVFLSL